MRTGFCWGLLALVLLVSGIPEPSYANKDIPGKWRLTYDWGCTGSPSEYALYIYPNHKFSTADGGHGTWAEAGRTFKLIYSNGCKPIYTGTFSEGHIKLEGRMNCTPGQMKLTTGNMGNGCWSAVKTHEPLPQEPDIFDGKETDSPKPNSATP